MQLSTFRLNLPAKRKWNAFVALITFLPLIAACTAPAAPPQSGARVMIEFREPAEGAEPALLTRLAAQSGTSIRHISAISAKLHAYELSCAVSDPNCTQAIERLRGEAGIASISPDHLRRHHGTPQP